MDRTRMNSRGVIVGNRRLPNAWDARRGIAYDRNEVGIVGAPWAPLDGI